MGAVRAQLLLGEFNPAVFVAMRSIEDRIRRLGRLDPNLHGIDAVSAAFGPEKPLRFPTEVPAEADGVYLLFRGAMLAFRNSTGHRPDAFDDDVTASEVVVFANLLHRMLDLMAPDDDRRPGHLLYTGAGLTPAARTKDRLGEHVGNKRAAGLGDVARDWRRSMSGNAAVKVRPTAACIERGAVPEEHLRAAERDGARVRRTPLLSRRIAGNQVRRPYPKLVEQSASGLRRRCSRSD